ncbi:hypothetical protein EBR43_02185 [bacterium]|nr:hypothetical protein [bacterium]
MLMKVSHESPLVLLEQSRNYNDFDYALVHLFERYPDYYNFFKNSRNTYNREVLLDNSIFELGKAFDSDKFFNAAKQLQPNMFIVPDVLESASQTVESFIQFSDKTKELKNSFQCRSIGAVQGNTWHDLINCYKFMANEADMIAISFDFSYYEITGEGVSRLERFCSGRQRFISQLIDRGLWEWNKPHHLLGCSLAREFRFYVDTNVYNIVSCDTSNPVVAAMHNLKYDADYGLYEKPNSKLADMMEHQFTTDQIDILNYNLKMFRKIIRR